MTIAAHYKATRAQLAGGSVLADGIPKPGDKRVYDVVRMNGDKPFRDNYVILWPDSPRLDDGRFTALQRPQSTMRYRFDTRVVATSMDALLLFQDAVRERLVGVTIPVPGRVTGPVRLVAAVEEGRLLNDASANLLHVTETFEFLSWEATPPSVP